MRFSSPTKITRKKLPVSIQSPDETGLFSPNFALDTPIGGIPLNGSTIVPITPSLFDPHRAQLRTKAMEHDFFDTFQISTVSSGISSLLSAIETVKEEEELEAARNMVIQQRLSPQKLKVTPHTITNTTSTAATHPKSELKSNSNAANAFMSPTFSTMKSRPKSKKTSSPDGIQCRCVKSKCLKLYCDCFASSKYCQADCKCEDCLNNVDHEPVRQLLFSFPEIFHFCITATQGCY